MDIGMSHLPETPLIPLEKRVIWGPLVVGGLNYTP